MGLFLTFLMVFFGLFIAEALLRGLAKLIFPFVVVGERECHILLVLGKVRAMYSEPGLHFVFNQMGAEAWFWALAGETRVIDTRLDQTYIRNLSVNSEDGSPMGVGVWYEMIVSDPNLYAFQNTDAPGSLRANVSNATVRCLSNLTLEEMMGDRHAMSQQVRREVSPQSGQWGYKLGSVYIRKVQFADKRMVAQIEEKVVNRLRQLTASILQDGNNRVSVIRSEAERKAATEFAKAAAVRPEIVGRALQEISRDPEVAEALFEVLETERILKGQAALTLIPPAANGDMTRSLVAAQAISYGGQVPVAQGAGLKSNVSTSQGPSFEIKL